MASSTNKLIIGIFAVLAISAGFFLRVDAMLLWERNPELFFSGNEPLLTSMDGYYYLNTAKEILNGTYSPVDTQRGIPDNVERSSIPSLMPLILATVTRISGLSLNWIAIFTPVALGLILGIPLYLFGKHWGGYVMALTSLAAGLLFHHYIIRTNLGRLDTDCLNVTLAISCSYLFMRFGNNTTNTRYIFLAAGFLFSFLFLWWWDMAFGPVALLSLTPLLIALLFHYRPQKKEGLFVIAALAVTILFFILTNWEMVSRIFSSAYEHLSYIIKHEGGLFPNIGKSITEQEKLTFSEIYRTSTLNLPIFICSLFGFCFLIFKKKAESFYLLPILFVGLLSVLYAKRFAIFLTPILALGLGFLFNEIYNRVTRKAIPTICYLLFFLYLTHTGFFTKNIQASSYPSPAIDGMRKVKDTTPENSAIWSWWDGGHALIYWSERGTISDGYIHGGEVTYWNALPLTTDNFQLSANFMQFYAKRGKKGIFRFQKAANLSLHDCIKTIQAILERSPKQAQAIINKLEFKNSGDKKNSTNWLEFFYPTDPTPVYLFLDSRLIKVLRWIYWNGTWDIPTRTGIKTLPTFSFHNLALKQNNQPASTAFSIDYQKGTFSAKSVFPGPVQLSQIVLTGSTTTKRIDYNTYPRGKILTHLDEHSLAEKVFKTDLFTGKGQYVLELLSDHNQVVLHDQKKADIVINRLFRRKEDYNPKYFQPVDLALPHYQIWKVKGDQLSRID